MKTENEKKTSKCAIKQIPLYFFHFLLFSIFYFIYVKWKQSVWLVMSAYSTP